MVGNRVDALVIVGATGDLVWPNWRPPPALVGLVCPQADGADPGRYQTHQGGPRLPHTTGSDSPPAPSTNGAGLASRGQIS
jgi:hypothetical protein